MSFDISAIVLLLFMSLPLPWSLHRRTAGNRTPDSYGARD